MSFDKKLIPPPAKVGDKLEKKEGDPTEKLHNKIADLEEKLKHKRFSNAGSGRTAAANRDYKKIKDDIKELEKQIKELETKN